MSDLDVRKLFTTALPADLRDAGPSTGDLVTASFARAARHRRLTLAGSTAACLATAAAVVAGFVWLAIDPSEARGLAPASKPSVSSTPHTTPAATRDFASAVAQVLGSAYTVGKDTVQRSAPGPSAVEWDDFTLSRGPLSDSMDIEVEHWPTSMVEAMKTEGCQGPSGPVKCVWQKVGAYTVIFRDSGHPMVIRPDGWVIQIEDDVFSSPRSSLLTPAELVSLATSEPLQRQLDQVAQRLK